jgi:two-component system response regulator FixJ
MPTTYIIHDDDAVRDSIRLLLECFGFVVSDYASCRAFLREVRPEANSCVLVNLDMPEMTSLQLLDQLRREGIAIVMTKRAGDPRIRAAVDRAGAMLLEKPFQPGELVRCIKEVLSHE